MDLAVDATAAFMFSVGSALAATIELESLIVLMQYNLAAKEFRRQELERRDKIAG
jgi:hypothetical protein